MTILESASGDEARSVVGDDRLSGPLATLLRRPAVVHPVGYVTIGRIGETAADGAWWVALAPGGRLSARTAISCVVKPRCGDLVQLYHTPAGNWILAILERREGGCDLVLDFGEASVRLQAHDVRMQARDRLTLEAARFASRAEVVTQAAGERHACVSGTDATHAGNTFVHTERHMGLHANSAVVTSASLLKVDAGQIHMG